MRDFITESEAEKKWCPLFRAQITHKAFNTGMMSNLEEDDNKADKMISDFWEEAECVCTCTASYCMWWGWEDGTHSKGRCEASGMLG